MAWGKTGTLQAVPVDGSVTAAKLAADALALIAAKLAKAGDTATGELIAAAGLRLATAPGPTVVNGVASHLLIEPSDANPAANAITVKRPGHAAGSWGNSTTPYGYGQVFELLDDSAVDASLSSDAANPVLFRIDPWGGLGFGHSVHVATGLRFQSDAGSITQAMWFQPYIDTIGILMDTPSTTAVPGTPTQDFLKVRDVRSAPYDLVRILADGTLASNKALTATSRATTDVTALLTAVASQTADVLRIVDRAGIKRLTVEPQFGGVTLFADDGTTGSIGLYGRSAGAFGARASFSTVNTGVVGVYVGGPTGQTADLQEWTVNNVLAARVNKAGYFMGRLTAAPVLADMVDGEWALWLSTGGNALKVSARIGGVLKTGTVAVA